MSLASGQKYLQIPTSRITDGPPLEPRAGISCFCTGLLAAGSLTSVELAESHHAALLIPLPPPLPPPPHPTSSSVFRLIVKVALARDTESLARIRARAGRQMQRYSLSNRRSCGTRNISFHYRCHRRSWLERFFMIAFFLERMASKTSGRKRRSCSL